MRKAKSEFKSIPLERNPYTKGSKAWLFLEISNVDYATGFSDPVWRDELDRHNLGTTNGGDWCRSDGALGKYFNIERIKEKGRIIGVKLQGYKKNHFSGRINKEIRDFYADKPCAVLAVSQNIEIDHKDGRKDWYNEHEQTADDFQSLHKTANTAKRQHCKACKESSLRFDARRLGYSVSQWIGPEAYSGTCVGCYWHDPIVFNAQVSASYKKRR